MLLSISWTPRRIAASLVSGELPHCAPRSKPGVERPVGCPFAVPSPGAHVPPPLHRCLVSSSGNVYLWGRGRPPLPARTQLRWT